MTDKPEKIYAYPGSLIYSLKPAEPHTDEYIRADLAKPSEWISVDNRLPKEMLRVLLVTNPRGEVGIGRRDEDNWCDDYHGYVSVTHWQPLPAPPTRDTP